MDLARERPAMFGLRRTQPSSHAVSVILFGAGGMRFAVEAREVMEIREHLDSGARLLKPKGVEPFDFAQQVGLGTGNLSRYVILKPGACWLGVAEVERIAVQPRLVALPRLFRGAERQWYRGLLLLDDEVVPLLRAEYWRSRQSDPLSGEGR